MSDPVIDTRPTTESAALVGGIALVGAVALVASSGALALALLGALLLGSGTVTGASRLVSLGALASLGGVVVGGLSGVGVVFLLVATVGALVSWDAAVHALDVGETVGRAADSTQALSVHAAVAGGVASITAGVGYAVYSVAGGGRPVGALVLLLTGAVLLEAALR